MPQPSCHFRAEDRFATIGTGWFSAGLSHRRRMVRLDFSRAAALDLASVKPEPDGSMRHRWKWGPRRSVAETLRSLESVLPLDARSFLAFDAPRARPSALRPSVTAQPSARRGFRIR
jgi:hypothetical protein